jgi:hypothetical protein
MIIFCVGRVAIIREVTMKNNILLCVIPCNLIVVY